MIKIRSRWNNSVGIRLDCFEGMQALRLYKVVFLVCIIITLRGIVDKRARCNETVQAQDALSDKCKRVVIENFALYPVHENTPAMSGSQYQFEFYTEIAGTCER